MMPNRMAAHGARMGAVVALSMMILAPVAHAQSNPPIDSDLVRPGAPATSAPASSPPAPAYAPSATGAPYAPAAQPTPMSATSVPPADGTTYHQDDLIGAAEGVFGKGAKGLAQLIQDILKKQGEPNAYIIGREAGGAFALGLRYGSGTLYHRVEGQRPAYWAGPSIGFDAGANAADTFMLVYNLHNTEDLYHRFGAGEGQAYMVGGFNVSYVRRGDIVLIPVRMGVGLRLGINGGYMKFSKKQNWNPL
ncbi:MULTISPECIES: DUF1134 domain-containing protein [unclassified Novosphingobium]|uniref:DUF1134 domain-containing protein n=1 Tax=unclassified Novosphingobium TaxID=2644732 RepID=UPI0008693266|nr:MULTISPECIES: DUF1134 domain-containing protein [unclassified Novosphingobium]MBN9146322.1 DUF1134 domain-containing protein [Novosphingobium sp.]MDR6710120.1 hypothetical protein [Novosphingobium sp. 1748]ODU80076.1 MAG: hypothetical protein ABT10_19100 [Novosphingobium sp. SCN 63-17]OJX91495.1 MAG: hypothetical protein BGP00_05165 [Novosphingobium sp. 63-713]